MNGAQKIGATGQEQLLSQRLSVFSGEWMLEAAENVCSDEEIPRGTVLELAGSLVKKSLVVVEQAEARMTGSAVVGMSFDYSDRAGKPSHHAGMGCEDQCEIGFVSIKQFAQVLGIY